MEALFKSRVEQAFGGLLGSAVHGVSAPLVASSSISSVTNAWSVSEVAIPCNSGPKVAEESSGNESDEPSAARYENFVKLAKRARRRQREEDVEGDFGKEMDVDDLDDLLDDRATKRRRGEDPEELVPAGPEALDEEEECRQVRLMVGMDDTLDFEEEEDVYDMLAVGREGVGERLYMSEVTGVPSEMSPLMPLPDSVPGCERRKFRRDSRANHAAAVARLKEDDRLATIKNSEVTRMLRLSSSLGTANDREPAGDGADSNVLPHAGGPSSLPQRKPALKKSGRVAGKGKTDSQSNNLSAVVVEQSMDNGAAHQNASQKDDLKDSAGQARETNSLTHGESGVRIEGKTKRVKFAEDTIKDKGNESVFSRDIQKVGKILKPKRDGRVPDHVLNPSKYTHYTLEWSDEEDDNKANLAAFQATQAIVRLAEEKEASGIVELPKCITFTPRSGGAVNKSNGEAKHTTGARDQKSQTLVSFAEEVLGTETARQTDDASQSFTSVIASTEAKTARVFRKRAREEVTE